MAAYALATQHGYSNLAIYALTQNVQVARLHHDRDTLITLLDDLEVITAAQEFARAIVEEDPDLTEHPGLATMTRSALDADRIEFLEKA